MKQKRKENKIEKERKLDRKEKKVKRKREQIRDKRLGKKRKDQSDEEEEGGEENEDDEDPSAQKKARVVWSVELHRKFVAAVNQLGLDSEFLKEKILRFQVV